MLTTCGTRSGTARAGVIAAAATAGVVLAGCGGSGSSKAAASTGTTTNPSTAPATQVGGKAGFTGQSICAAVPASQVELALGTAAGSGQAAEPKAGIHACSWKASDGSNALVAVIFDDSFDKGFVDDPVSLTNDAAGTSFPTATNTTIDVGARNVTVYGLSASDDRVATSGLSTVANTVNDFIVDSDQAAG